MLGDGYALRLCVFFVLTPVLLCSSLSPPVQKEVYMIAAGVVAAVFLVCTVIMFLGVRERDGECLCVRGCQWKPLSV